MAADGGSRPVEGSACASDGMLAGKAALTCRSCSHALCTTCLHGAIFVQVLQVHFRCMCLKERQEGELIGVEQATSVVVVEYWSGCCILVMMFQWVDGYQNQQHSQFGHAMSVLPSQSQSVTGQLSAAQSQCLLHLYLALCTLHANWTAILTDVRQPTLCRCRFYIRQLSRMVWTCSLLRIPVVPSFTEHACVAVSVYTILVC